ncbi:MAG: hypothetical protein HQL46_09065 [Gammaproteobacteria bacterium]|nr:hypothetical protein [Gammaproteobacteria bacterium]
MTPNRRSLTYSVALFFLLSVPLVQAEKVTLETSNWGLEGGKACVSCHEKSSAGLTMQWQNSAHAKNKVNCLDCHQAKKEEEDAIEHEGAIISVIVSPKDCGRCHGKEFEQQQGSKHSQAMSSITARMPHLAKQMGDNSTLLLSCAKCHGSKVEVNGDGTINPLTWPNNGIGRINPDGSLGSCSACHGRHQFSKQQARQPEACTHCHHGTDSPDKDIYANSKHGMMYQGFKSKMNLDSDNWVAGQDYYAAPTCVTCHMGAAGKIKSSHDVGMRDSWNLNRPISKKQSLVILDNGNKIEVADDEAPSRRGESIELADGTTAKVKAIASSKRRRQVMSNVCQECHSKMFAKSHFNNMDAQIELYNDKYGLPAQQIMAQLYEDKLLTPMPFDETIEVTFWELWHNEGTRFRHAAAMGDKSAAWWEGIFSLGTNFYGKFLPQLKQLAGKEKAEQLITEHVKENDNHLWFNNLNKESKLLGVEKGNDEYDF